MPITSISALPVRSTSWCENRWLSDAWKCLHQILFYDMTDGCDVKFWTLKWNSQAEYIYIYIVDYLRWGVRGLKNTVGTSATALLGGEVQTFCDRTTGKFSKMLGSLTRVTKSNLLALGTTQISSFFTRHWTKFLTHHRGNYPVTCFVSKPSRITLVDLSIINTVCWELWETDAAWCVIVMYAIVLFIGGWSD